MKRILTAFCLAVLASALLGLAAPGIAQTYPDHETITVNDFAGLLPDDVEAQIVAELDQLRADTGIEMTVVTLSRRTCSPPIRTWRPSRPACSINGGSAMRPATTASCS
ncbi:MAG: TPM domain-containing protein [Paracoccaceae bacterium]